MVFSSFSLKKDKSVPGRAIMLSFFIQNSNDFPLSKTYRLLPCHGYPCFVVCFHVFPSLTMYCDVYPCMPIYYVDTSVSLENIPLVKFIKTISEHESVVYF